MPSLAGLREQRRRGEVTALYPQSARPPADVAPSSPHSQEGAGDRLLPSPSLAHRGRCPGSCSGAALPGASPRALGTHQRPVSAPGCSPGRSTKAQGRGTPGSRLTSEPHSLPPQGLLRALQVGQALGQVLLCCAAPPGQLQREGRGLSAGRPRPRPRPRPRVQNCAYQALADLPALQRLGQVRQLPPAQDARDTKEGFPGGLQNS